MRGDSFEAINEANKKVNRALCGAALSLGTNIDITDIPGYSPLNNDVNMIELAKDAAALALPEEPFNINQTKSTGSTDMGDLSCIMPVIHPYAAGGEGIGHGENYRIADPEKACVSSAKWQLAMLLLLLENNAVRAKKIINEYTPLFASKEDFLNYVDSLNSTGDRIVYREDEVAEIKL